jgi:hypothetical protein
MALQQAFDPPDDCAMLTDLVGVAHQLHVFQTLQLTRRHEWYHEQSAALWLTEM